MCMLFIENAILDILNESITKEKDYTYIYTLSLELDELITRYYNKKIRTRIYTKDRR